MLRQHASPPNRRARRAYLSGDVRRYVQALIDSRRPQHARMTKELGKKIARRLALRSVPDPARLSVATPQD